MRSFALALALAVPALAACSALGPVLDAQRETLARVEALESQVEAARGAAVEIQRRYEAGEVSAAERDAALNRIRAETLDALAALRAALEATGAAVAAIDPADLTEDALRGAAPLLPPPWDMLATAAAALAGAYGLSRREARRASADLDVQRELRRAQRGEVVGVPVPGAGTARSTLAHGGAYAAHVPDPVDATTQSVARRKISRA